MLKLNDIQQRLPYGGHQYPENGHIIRGDTFKELVNNVSAYRVNNHIPIGNPEQDVLFHYAKHWPWMVKEDREAVEVKEDSAYAEYREWVEFTWRHPITRIITPKQASDRWKVCETCPYNQKRDWKETKESTELARRAFLLRRGVGVPKNLGICSLHKNADIPVLSFSEIPVSNAERRKDAELPAGCWVV